jgi:hypothetical protein
MRNRYICAKRSLLYSSKQCAFMGIEMRVRNRKAISLYHEECTLSAGDKNSFLKEMNSELQGGWGNIYSLQKKLE